MGWGRGGQPRQRWAAGATVSSGDKVVGGMEGKERIKGGEEEEG